MRIKAFFNRNFKEILRDPVSYIFCLGMPILMLVLMTVINQSIPKEANMVIFNIDNLSCGIAVFSLSFTMLCSALLVSRDKTTAFLQRLFSSPMKSSDFMLGYALPFIALAVGQVLVTFACSGVISLITKETLDFSGTVLAIVTLLPAAILFISLGVCIGFLLGEKSSPPVCSLIVTLSGLLGGIWFDSSIVGGAIDTICRILPFYNAVACARAAISLNFEGILLPLMITLVYTAVSVVGAILAFKYKSRK